MTVTKLQESEGALDASLENLLASLVGTVVDYLSRLANVCTTDVSEALVNNFRVSLDGARNIAAQSEHISVTADAAAALLELNFTEHSDDIITFDIDDTAVRVACQLVSYDVGKRAGVMFYKPEYSLIPPDETTTAHILNMVARAQAFFLKCGPVTKDGFVFADAKKFLMGERGGYTDVVDSGDGDFLTADTLWDFKVSKAKPSKDHTLQLLMYFLMGKASGLPEFATQTQVGLFNPRLNSVHVLAVADVPADVMDTIRHDVIGYGA